MDRLPILIIEDDPNNSMLLAGRLMQSGFYVSCVGDGQAALSVINDEKPPALVLLDQHMPFCDGFTLLMAMQRNPLWAATPVIMLSASNTERDEATAFNLGARDFVTKPIRPDSLIARIRMALNINLLRSTHE